MIIRRISAQTMPTTITAIVPVASSLVLLTLPVTTKIWIANLAVGKMKRNLVPIQYLNFYLKVANFNTLHTDWFRQSVKLTLMTCFLSMQVLRKTDWTQHYH